MISHETTDDGIRVRDHIESVEMVLGTDPVEAVGDADADRFAAPIDDAIAVVSSELAIPVRTNVFVRDAATGETLLNSHAGSGGAVPPGSYEVEVGSTPLKLYVRVDDSKIRVVHESDDTTTLRFGDPTTVAVGLRSRHERPAATITTTDDPEDAMAAVSQLGSALKTTSPERSFPTLRGHPPLLELGDELDVPSRIARPDTGVRIEVPPEIDAIYTVAPLAYYLGAEVVPGPDDSIRLHAAGRTHPVYDPDGVAAEPRTRARHRAVADLHEHLFTLDCVVRTVGLYEVDLAEYGTVRERLAESDVDADLERWYDLPLDERTVAYLDVPREVTDGVVDWYMTADVAPDAENVAYLPHVVDRLAHVRSPPATWDRPAEMGSAAERHQEAVADFFRGDGGVEERRASDPHASSEPDSGSRSGSTSGYASTAAETASSPSLPRSGQPEDDVSEGGADGDSSATGESAAARPPEPANVFSPPETDALAHVWIDEGLPIGASKPTLGAYRRALEREPEESPTIDIQIVCNDPQMLEETGELYGFREHLAFDISMAEELTTDELRGVLHQETDFFHYIGHVDDDGMRCTDGSLDLRTLEETGAEAFLLNGCRSYQQGMELVEAGALGGIVTTAIVYNATATRAGQVIANLMDAGFDLFGAVDVLMNQLEVGSRYAIVGDGGVTLCQRSGYPVITHLRHAPADQPEPFQQCSIIYPTRRFDVGTFGYLTGYEKPRVDVGSVGWRSVDEAGIRSLFENEREPIIVDAELVWTDLSSPDSVLSDLNY